MATTNTMFEFLATDGQPPQTNYATLDTFAAADGDRYVLDYVGSGGSADETSYFEGFWPSEYDGGGIDVVIDYSTDGTSGGAVEWEVSVEVLQNTDDQDAGGQTFGTITNIADTPSTATANVLDRTAVGAITHANCGSPAVGDRMRMKVTRDHDHATNTDDGQLHGLYITET